MSVQRAWLRLLLFIACAPATAWADDAEKHGAATAGGSPTTTFSLSASPSFFATTAPGSIVGNYDNGLLAASLAHMFANGVIATADFQWQPNADGSAQFYAELDLGYALQAGRFTLTPAAGIGQTWDATGLGPDGDSAATYYALYLNGDLELNPRWTWNAFQLMWRNAFDTRWITPSVGTGLTYQATDTTSLFGSGNYSWTDTGQPSDSNSFGFAFGVSQSF